MKSAPYTIAVAGAPCIKLRFVIQPYGGGEVLVADSVMAGDSITISLPDTGVYSGSGEMVIDSLGTIPGWWNLYAPGTIHFGCQ